MPKKSGIEVLRWLRSQKKNTPFIIHTGFGSKELANEAQKLGIFALIEKPWNEDVFLNTMKNAIEYGQKLDKT